LLAERRGHTRPAWALAQARYDLSHREIASAAQVSHGTIRALLTRSPAKRAEDAQSDSAQGNGMLTSSEETR
jgi:orotate phosphoribosyltransferase-like protein